MILANQLTKRFEDFTALRSLNCEIEKGCIYGMVGSNGAGKSTLLKLLAGILQPDSSTITWGDTVQIGYFAQECETMNPTQKVIDYIRETAERIQTPEGTVTAATMLERFLFTPELQWNRIEKLSGGERKRLYLLKILMAAPNILLLDEPTNDLDIVTLTILEDYLKSFSGAVIAISHDRYFLDKVATKILAFEDGKIRPFFGHYTDYLDEKAFETEMANQVQKAEKEKVVKVREDKKRMTYQEKQEWASIEGDIEALENRIAAIEEEMQANGSDFGKLATLQKELDEKNEALLEKYERYEYLSEFDN